VLEDLDATEGLAAVRAILLDLGKNDSAFLHRAVNSLFESAPDLLLPIAVLTLTDVLGSPADDRAVRFAAALQCVVAATALHRAGPRGAPDHLEVLAGDYLYAQAAVLTSRLNQLSIMRGLSRAIKLLCRNSLEHPTEPGLRPLFELGAEAVACLLTLDPERAQAVVGYGRLLDRLRASHDLSGAHHEARCFAEHFASGRAIGRICALAERVASSAALALGTVHPLSASNGAAAGKD